MEDEAVYAKSGNLGSVVCDDGGDKLVSVWSDSYRSFLEGEAIEFDTDSSEIIVVE